jgi:hypothetical protein
MRTSLQTYLLLLLLTALPCRLAHADQPLGTGLEGLEYPFPLAPHLEAPELFHSELLRFLEGESDTSTQRR